MSYKGNLIQNIYGILANSITAASIVLTSYIMNNTNDAGKFDCESGAGNYCTNSIYAFFALAITNLSLQSVNLIWKAQYLKRLE